MDRSQRFVPWRRGDRYGSYLLCVSDWAVVVAGKQLRMKARMYPSRVLLREARHPRSPIRRAGFLWSRGADGSKKFDSGL